MYSYKIPLMDVSGNSITVTGQATQGFGDLRCAKCNRLLGYSIGHTPIDLINFYCRTCKEELEYPPTGNP